MTFNDGIQAAANFLCKGCKEGLELVSIRSHPKTEFGPPNWDFQVEPLDALSKEVRDLEIQMKADEASKKREEYRSQWSAPVHKLTDEEYSKSYRICRAWEILKLKEKYELGEHREG